MADQASGNEPLVLVDRPQPALARVLLNRPHRRNALTEPLVDQFATALDELHDDDEVSVIVIGGAGGAFCSGLDLGEFGSPPKQELLQEFGAKWRHVHRTLFASDRIIIGALERAAVNGGAGLAFACDLLVVGDESFLQVGEIQIGMAAPMNMAWLQQRFHEALIARVTLIGDRIPGPELVRLGIAHQSVPDEDVMARTLELAQKLADYDPQTARRMKASLRTASTVFTA